MKPGQTVEGQWDYLVVTASNATQAGAYEAQLAVRRGLGLLHGVSEVLVVADPEGKRVGSGGSTVHCLVTILNRERERNAQGILDSDWISGCLSRLRVLIVHAGGDSKRLPTYGPCGKIFVPVPGEGDSALTPTLFDRQLPTYLSLPRPEGGRGQTVVTSGDVLLGFDPELVRFAQEGVTGLGCHATPEQASHHGVYCTANGRVRRFLQKPSPESQHAQGAVDRYGRSVLDIGVMSFDAAASARLLELCGVAPNGDACLDWSGPIVETVFSQGLDLYREIACAMGSETSCDDYIYEVRQSGCAIEGDRLQKIHEALRGVPFHVQTLPHCPFLHFGTLRQLVSSGLDLLRLDHDMPPRHAVLSVGNRFGENGTLSGMDAWVEGCRINATVSLAGDNVLAGATVDSALSLPNGACVDVLEGCNRRHEKVWFTRIYHAGDDFKGHILWNRPLKDWLEISGAAPEEIWDHTLSDAERGVWNARFFPADADPQGYRRWLWLTEPDAATPGQWREWRNADRYSLAEMALLADQEAFHTRRMALRAEEMLDSLPRFFRGDSGFSAADLAHVLQHLPDGTPWLGRVLRELALRDRSCAESELHGLESARIVHTLASAVESLNDSNPAFDKSFQYQASLLDSEEKAWLEKAGLSLGSNTKPLEWTASAKSFAFIHIGRTITGSAPQWSAPPRNTLRRDEIVWGRAPARLDLAGGWSDTPPYTLEEGGCVLNAAVTLNGQPPIQAYVRVVSEPVIRLASIDYGVREEITELGQLLDYRRPGSGFALPKAALALSGFSPDLAPWPGNVTLRAMLEQFGGGIELTTLAAIPGGSGLGTSSIMGAVIFSVIQRMLGNTLTPREIFNAVLRLEQELTTGGGWQDQIGGAVGGAKIITTTPGLLPDPSIHFVPDQELTPFERGGCALLYYTGITRLAKNILQNVVGGWLDRDRAAAATLRAIHASPRQTAEAMSRHDTEAFGHALDTAWSLKKRLDPGSTTREIEAIINSVRPRLHGAKIMGAGGGGFILMIARSPEDARAVRETLTQAPPNDRARFFAFDICPQGLVVTAC